MSQKTIDAIKQRESDKADATVIQHPQPARKPRAEKPPEKPTDIEPASEPA